MPATRSESLSETHASQAPEVIRVSSPASLLAAVPVVLKFQPSEPSFVVLGIVQPCSQVAVALRYDITDPGITDATARHAAAVLGAQGINTAVAVGYGTEALVTPLADALRATFTGAGITVTELLRACGGLYWSYVCADSQCCPPEGVKYDLEAHPVTRKHGQLILASRDALAATVAPVTGEPARQMRQAARAARRRAYRLATRVAARAGEGKAPRRALLAPKLKAVTDAISLYRSGGKLESHRDAAWLALALKDLAVRDDAWARMDPAHRKAHLRLWTDLTTMAQGDDAVAPAALLAFCAWQDGDGALGNVALDRALAQDPEYSMALLLRDALDAGAPPSMARLPMTPEEVAAAYSYSEENGEQDATADDSAASARVLTDTTA